MPLSRCEALTIWDVGQTLRQTAFFMEGSEAVIEERQHGTDRILYVGMRIKLARAPGG